jgi:cardiolipin synthase
MVRINGPAVRALEHVLLNDWNFATNEVVKHIEYENSPPCGDVTCAVIASGPDRESWIHDTLFIAMTLAKTRIWIVTPYFIPSLALQTALRTAATRGLDVRVLVPATSDVPIVKYASRSYYPELLQSGVRIYEYREQMIHAKAFVIDDDLSSVGSANMDTRSFRLSFEAGCYFHDPQSNRTLVEWYEGLLENATMIALDEFEARSAPQKLLESAAHLFSPLL